MSIDKQTLERVYVNIPINPDAAYQGMADRLMPDHARKRKFDEQQQAIAANLNDDPNFMVPNPSDLDRDSVLTVTHIAAVTLEINRVHRCANIDWARDYGKYATGAAAAALKNLVTRTDRIAMHFDRRPGDLLAADVGFDFAASRQWHVPPALQAKNIHQNERVIPTEAAGASVGVEAGKAGLLVKVPVQGNSTKTRRKDSIDPVIELAQAKCRDPKDTNQVWPQMQVLADSEQAPFIASTAEGLKYHKKGGDAYFTRDALDKRLHPEKRKPPAVRR